MKIFTRKKYKITRSTYYGYGYLYGTHDRTRVVFRLFGIPIWSHTRKPADRGAA